MDALRRRPHEPEDGSEYMGLAVGVLGSILLSVAMLPLRDHLDNNVMALALVVPVLLAAVLGGRWPGACSALAAAFCFDFFFTLPYQSMRIASSDDVSSFFVLLVVALIAAEVGIRARRGGRAARDARSGLDRLLRVIEIAARPGDIEDVISSARAEIIGLFNLVDCVFEADHAGWRAAEARHPWHARRRAARRQPTRSSSSRRVASRSKWSGAAFVSGGWCCMRPSRYARRSRSAPLQSPSRINSASRSPRSR